MDDPTYSKYVCMYVYVNNTLQTMFCLHCPLGDLVFHVLSNSECMLPRQASLVGFSHCSSVIALSGREELNYKWLQFHLLSSNV